MNGNEILLDTNIVLYLLSGNETLSVYLQHKEAYISEITELELIGYPDLSGRELLQIKLFLKDCTIVPITAEIKDIYMNLRKQYRLKLGDAVTAATAIHLDFPFISADKDFSKVKELRLMLYSI